MDLTAYCLDTSAYTYFRLGNSKVAELIDSARWVGLPAVVIGELLGGFQLGQNRQHKEMELWDLLADPAADVLEIDVSVAERYAVIYADLRRRGTPIPTNDIWVAATASATGSTVLTFDKHFEVIPQLGAIVLNAG